VDGVLEGGGGFGVGVAIDLDMVADVAVRLDLVGANSGGTWHSSIGVDQQILPGPYVFPTIALTDVAGIRMDAEGFQDEVVQGLELISRQDAADGGAQGNDSTFNPTISADGRFVAFISRASNLIPGGGVDVNGGRGGEDIFVFDRTTGSLELISRQGDADGGAQADNGSDRPTISADGRFVAFDSRATNLIPGGDDNTGSLELVSRKDDADGGAQGNDSSFSPTISADGRFVAFFSSATNLIPGGGSDANGGSYDAFVFDRTTGGLELVSRQDAADGGAQGNDSTSNPTISADGRFVAFSSQATNLVPGGGLDVNGTAKDVFVFDRATGGLELVSRQDAADGGAQGDGSSSRPTISADGRFVAFYSFATNLIPGGDVNGSAQDVFVFDRTTGGLELVSRQDDADGGTQGNGGSNDPTISADGRFVAFYSRATNLIPGGDDNGSNSDAFVFDRTTGGLKLVSSQGDADGGAQGNGGSSNPSISADGHFVAFQSIATNLIPGGAPDANGSGLDVFVHGPDTDDDGVLDGADNCQSIANGGQENNDGDALGDACDPDDDNDTVADGVDNCLFDANPLQEDNEPDGIGDICDPDDDNDGVLDAEPDNCLFTANPLQEDNELDGIGDICDPDDDNDGVLDAAPDNCLFTANPLQEDNESDGIGDICDPDDDNDTVADGVDNCPTVANLDQLQTGNNVGGAFGDACVDPSVVVPDNADVDPTSTVGAGTQINTGVTVEAGAEVGDNVLLNKGATVGEDTVVGDDAVLNQGVELGPNVTVGDNVTIGKNTIIGAGAVIGDNSQIGRDNIIEENADVGASCVGACPDPNVVTGKTVTITTGAVVPPGTTIPQGQTFP
jgi:Tol biopolymer transport system component/acetyltransferase-like isoleucine patch superfamily enzyme